ncbi:hypothetical protein MP638_002661 [Amoeboaphelidium occidentale]|nr:hypothetical protein MP638_002661 [Amoeboaphelidium occidentale]
MLRVFCGRLQRTRFNYSPVVRWNSIVVSATKAKHDDLKKSSMNPNVLMNDFELRTETGGDKREFTEWHYTEKLSLLEALIKTKQIHRSLHLLQSLSVNYPVLSKELLTNEVLNNLLYSARGYSMNEFMMIYRKMKSIDWFNCNERGYLSILRSYLHTQLSESSQAVGAKNGSGAVNVFFQKLVSEINRKYDLESLVENSIIFNEQELTLLKQLLANMKETKTSENDLFLPKSKAEIKETEGVDNLAYVKQSLIPMHERSMTTEVSDNDLDFQARLEQQTFVINLSKLKKDSVSRQVSTGLGIINPQLRPLLGYWHKTLVQKLTEMTSTSGYTLNEDEDIRSFLMLFTQVKNGLSVAALTSLTQFLKAASEQKDSVVSALLVTRIGNALEQEYKMAILESNKDIKKKLFGSYKALSATNVAVRLKKYRELQTKHGSNLANWEDEIGMEWGDFAKAKLGSAFASLIIDIAKIKLDSQGRFTTAAATAKLLKNGEKSNKDEAFAEKEEYLVKEEPVFTHALAYSKGQKQGVIKIHDEFLRIIGESAVQSHSGEKVSEEAVKGLIMPKLLPMIVPPKPWVTYDSGGYLTIKTCCMRAATKEQEMFLKQGSLTGELSQVLAGLDVLGQTKWRVHDRLLEHMIKVWNLGKPFAGFSAVTTKKPPTVPKPSNFAELSTEQKYEYYKSAKKARQEFYDNKSLRATENYRLEIAKAFCGRTIYFPQSLDFRGRVYPIPQLFNHIGDDIARSLLIFDTAKPLGSKGLKWLQVHLANCYGKDKASFEERTAFVLENKDNILKSAADPFGNSDQNQWWTKGDKPWMTLSACIELADVWNSGKNPEEFESRLPVHQDGSCNGLQHYAALGGDIEGGEQVNLINTGEKKDVYMAVVEKVKKLVEKDLQWADTENEKREVPNEKEIIHAHFSQKHITKHFASILTPERIERKTIKQTVMTSVYGVTMIGARDQIYARLKEKYVPEVYSEVTARHLAKYLSIKVFSALDSMFSNARLIQVWLARAAKEIARSVPNSELEKYRALENAVTEFQQKSGGSNKKVQSKDRITENKLKTSISKLRLNRNSSVCWTTPLGLTVVQPYKNEKMNMVSTKLQNFSLFNNTVPSSVNVSRQSSAFPPNFVHSLDATHMIMTALACYERENPIDFASVHDSYWTHACDVDELRSILKEQFVALHSTPVLENLRQDFIKRYSDRKVLNEYTVEEAAKRLREYNQRGVPYKYDKARSRFVVDTDTLKENKEDVDQDQILATTETSQGHTVPNDDIKEWQKLLGVSKSTKFLKIWEDIEFPELPKKGDLDLNAVKDSEYFFS